MDKNDTIITVGVTEKDEYGHLWVTPQGGGDKIKISSKRDRLHPLFEQGKAVLLHWETYKNIPYVSDAKTVEGVLPEPEEPISPEPVPDEYHPTVSGQERGMCWKEIGEMSRTPFPPTSVLVWMFGKENAIKIAKEYRGYLLATLKLPFDGKKLPKWEQEE